MLNILVAAVNPQLLRDIKIKQKEKEHNQDIRRGTEEYSHLVLEHSVPPSQQAILQLRESLLNAMVSMSVFVPAVHALQPERFRTSPAPPAVVHAQLPCMASFMDECILPCHGVTVSSEPLSIAHLPHNLFTSVHDLGYEAEKKEFIKKVYYDAKNRQKIDQMTGTKQKHKLVCAALCATYKF